MLLVFLSSKALGLGLVCRLLLAGSCTVSSGLSQYTLQPYTMFPQKPKEV